MWILVYRETSSEINLYSLDMLTVWINFLKTKESFIKDLFLQVTFAMHVDKYFGNFL